MLQKRHVILLLLLVAFPASVSRAEDSQAIATLKKKELTRTGRYFVIDAEQSVVEKWKDTRASLADYLATAERKNQADEASYQATQLENQRAELQQRLTDLNQQINEQGFQQPSPRQGGFGQGNSGPGGFGQGGFLSQLINQRNMIRMNLSQIDSMQRTAKANMGTDRKALDTENQKNLEAARTALKQFRESVDAVTKRYDELGEDATVKSALHALEEGKVASFKLGPTTPFKNTVKALENAERLVLAKRTTTISRKKSKSRR